jgi:hypothetical protein
MPKSNKMVNNPSIVETQVKKLLDERKQWINGKKYKGFNNSKFVEHMKEKYEYLYNASPALFNKLISGFMDDPINYEMLMKMLNLSKDIYKGNKKQEEVDKGLGKVLADKYVKPVVDKLDKKK